MTDDKRALRRAAAMTDGENVDCGVEKDAGLVSVFSDNATAFAAILRLYARPGQVVVDPTYGSGVFWRHVDATLYDARLSDGGNGGCDLRATGYDNASVDVVVCDPPYRYTPAKNQKHVALDDRYQLQASAPTRTQGVIELYVAGMAEAKRILRVGGFLVVKCQDTVQDGKQIWVHCDLIGHAERLGFACRDLAVVTPPNVTGTRWERQRHLRKAHSYFLVFRKGGHFPFGLPSMEQR